jgi:hypothetical protein
VAEPGNEENKGGPSLTCHVCPNRTGLDADSTLTMAASRLFVRCNALEWQGVSRRIGEFKHMAHVESPFDSDLGA